MSLTPAMIDAMVASGCTPEQIAAVVKADMQDRDGRVNVKRAKDAERQRRHRASRDVTVTECDPLPPKDNIQNPHPETGSDEPVKTARAAKAHKLPADWEPILTPEAQRKVAGWPPGRFEEVVAAFCDHAADKGRTSKDWQAAFRTWISNENRWKPANGRSNTNTVAGLRGSRPDPALDMLYQAERELQAEAEREGQIIDFAPRAALPAYQSGRS